MLSIYKELAEAKNDKVMYQKSVDLGQQHFADLGRTTLNPLQEAKMEALSAQVIDKHENMLGYEQKMEAAITLVKKQDPFHQRIGVYNNVLGTERQLSIKRKMQLSPIEKHPMEGSNLLHRDYVQMSEEGRPAPSDKFNYEEC